MLSLSGHGAILGALHVIAAVAGLAWIALQLTTTREREPESVAGPRGEQRWYWLRWCAMIAFLAVWGIVAVRTARGVPFRAPAMTLFMTSVGIACVQWFNVWFIAWPALHTGGTRARTRAAAALAVNRATVIPMVFFFGAASWATDLGGHGRWIPSAYWMLTAGLYGLLTVLPLVVPGLARSLLGPLPIGLVVGALLPLTARVL